MKMAIKEQIIDILTKRNITGCCELAQEILEDTELKDVLINFVKLSFFHGDEVGGITYNHVMEIVKTFEKK